MLLLFYMSYGAVRTMRAANAGLDLRQEDLPVVQAARGGATGRGHPVPEGRDGAVVAAAVKFDGGHAGYFWRNVAVFLGDDAGDRRLDVRAIPRARIWCDWGANFGPLTVGGQWWRLLTCVFLHGGLLHIAFNMWCLWDLGRLAESVYGHWTFAIVYLICGLSASIGSVLWNPAVLSVGASGAIFGIAGALIASFYLGEFSLPRAAVTGMLRSVVMFVGYNLVFWGDHCAHRQCGARRRAGNGIDSGGADRAAGSGA